LHGFLPPAQIPSKFSVEKELAVLAELEPDWVCDFFLQDAGGSCLGADIPLGAVGKFDPARGGAFEITIPDFTRDPLFKGIGDASWFGDFGVILLGLQEKKIGRGWWGIKPEKAGPKSGLNIESEYANAVKFTSVR
jgi:hypothetical protein